MTVSSRLTQERLAELLREVDALHDGLAPLTPEQKAAWLLPHLGAQEAPPEYDTETERGRRGYDDPPKPSSAGSSAVPPSQNRDVIGRLVVAAEALVLVADDEVAGLPQRLRSHGHLDARDREALKRTKEMCDAVLRATAVVREQIGRSPTVSGPWKSDGCAVFNVTETGNPRHGYIFDSEAEARAVRDALNRVAAQRPQEESR